MLNNGNGVWCEQNPIIIIVPFQEFDCKYAFYAYVIKYSDLV